MQKPKRQERFDDSFYKLATGVTKALHDNEAEDPDSDQKEQVEELLDAERKFKEVILKYRQATEIYKRFLQLVCVTNGNILSARPYFREGAKPFSKKVTPAIKKNDIETLKTFNVNFQFIKFTRDTWLGPFPVRAEKLYQRVHNARRVLIENNMPLAINRAKLFYRKTPRSHLTLLDLIEICAIGLASGIDKYSAPKYTPVFRSVCIGRMTGNMIEAYSETVLHFYPSDKRILYRANSIRGRQGITDIVELTKAVNDSFDQDEREGRTIPAKNITVSYLSGLMSAASTISAESTVNDEGFGIFHFTADDAPGAEESMLDREQYSAMHKSARTLPLMHRKVLKLKGLKI